MEASVLDEKPDCVSGDRAWTEKKDNRVADQDMNGGFRSEFMGIFCHRHFFIFNAQLVGL